MKLYNGMSPNGARVSIFLAEKGIDIPVAPVGVLEGGTQKPEFLKINSLGEVPVLELDNGRHLPESIAICRYIEDLHPQPALFGTTPEEKAFIEMWNRRIELKLFNAIGDAALHELEFFKDRIEQIPAHAQARRRDFTEKLEWLDQELSDRRPFIAGDSFSVADITGMATLMIAGYLKAQLPDGLPHFQRWATAMQARPSFPKPPTG